MSFKNQKKNFKRKFPSSSASGGFKTKGGVPAAASLRSADDLDDDFTTSIVVDGRSGSADDQTRQQQQQQKGRDKNVRRRGNGKEEDEDLDEDEKRGKKKLKIASSISTTTSTQQLPPPASPEIGDPKKLLEQIQLPVNVNPEDIPLQVWTKAAGRKGVLQQMVDKLGRKKEAKTTKDTNSAIKAAGSPEEEAKFFNVLFFRHCGSQMSALERDTLALKASHFLAPSSKATSPELLKKYMSHTDPLLLPDFLREVLPKKAEELLAPRTPKDAFGAPVLLVMSSAAIRSSHLYSSCLRSGLQAKGTEMMKLFAKHFTLEEHMTMLSKTITRVGFATPNRVLKLLDTPASFFNSSSSSSSSSSSTTSSDEKKALKSSPGSAGSISALDLDSCKYLVIDLFLNKQEKTTFEVTEVAKDLWELYKKHLHHRVLEGKMKIIFY